MLEFHHVLARKTIFKADEGDEVCGTHVSVCGEVQIIFRITSGSSGHNPFHWIRSKLKPEFQNIIFYEQNLDVLDHPDGL